MRILLAALLLFAAVFPAAASRFSAFPQKLRPNQFDQVVSLIEQEMTPGGSFEHVDADQQVVVRDRLRRMSELLNGRTSLDELSEDQKVLLINNQEAVNAILLDAPEEQVVCQRRELVGSHQIETVCESKRDAARRREMSQQEMKRLQKNIQLLPDQ